MPPETSAVCLSVQVHAISRRRSSYVRLRTRIEAQRSTVGEPRSAAVSHDVEGVFHWRILS